MNSLKDKVVIITGGVEGIGLALANSFLNAGSTVIVYDIKSPAKATIDPLLNSSANILYYTGDVTNKRQVSKFTKLVQSKSKKVDILINNAGASIARMNAYDTPFNLSEWLFQVNYWGSVYFIHNFLSQGGLFAGSRIVNICSIYSFLGVYHRSAYCASKSALKSYTQTLRQELSTSGIKVISVFPGMVKSCITLNSKGWKSDVDKKIAVKIQENCRATRPEKAAKEIIAGIMKGKQSIYIGTDANLIRWILRFLPIRGEKLINHIIKRSEKRIRKKVLNAKTTHESLPALSWKMLFSFQSLR
jgi:NAD(P)-dependent dehydrogenase (short-subunit alcohol dehydrogenase family)